MPGMETAGFDYDWLVIGSGFGGSVSALRLAEKGYRVAVLECGRRFRDEDFAESAWNLRRYFWSPRLGMRGIFRMTLFKDVFIVSGSGVGGGSLGYANTLYRARPAFFEDQQWDGLGEWDEELGPHYDTAERMLGVADYEGMTPADELLQEYGEDDRRRRHLQQHAGRGLLRRAGRRRCRTPTSVARARRAAAASAAAAAWSAAGTAPRTRWSRTTSGSPRSGVPRSIPERQVTDVRPLGAADGSDGYAVTTERPGAWVRRRRRTLTARGVVVAAGALGTNKLLANCKRTGALPRLSDRLGEVVRTNSESIQAVTVPDDERDFTRSVAITSSIYPDPDTHIEVVTYGSRGRRDELPLHGDDRPRHTRHQAAEVDRGDAAPPSADPAPPVAVAVVAADRDPAGHADRSTRR